jgi:hypothetical protein
VKHRSCSPAPPPADAARYRLTDAAGQLLEKRLRSLLSRCAEWNDPEERHRLVAALEAEEAASGAVSGAVEVLRAHSSAQMRKHAMLRLCHAWRYRSDCWSARPPGAAASRKRSPRADEPPPAKRAAAPPAARTLVAPQAAQARVFGLVMPFVNAAARAWAGPLSAVQYGRVRGDGMTWLRVRGIDGACEVSDWLAAVLKQRLVGLRAWRETLDADALRAPAYLCDAAYVSPDSELASMLNIIAHSRATTDVFAQRIRDADGGLTPQYAAWVQDYYDGHNAVLGRAPPIRLFLMRSLVVVTTSSDPLFYSHQRSGGRAERVCVRPPHGVAAHVPGRRGSCA